jgi:hypothetical protein
LHNNVKNSGPRCARAAATQRQLLAVTALLATLLTTLAALSTLLASLPGLVLAALLLLARLLLPAAAALLRVARVLLLVATRFVLARIVRHRTFSSYFQGFARGPPGPLSKCAASCFVPFCGCPNFAQ